MGITAAAEKDYCRAISDLFPKGEYWDRQFADPESDVSLFCLAKTQEIIRIRERMHDLFLEGIYKTAVETIDDWERALLGYMNAQLPLEERRKILGIQKDGMINRKIISDLAEMNGLSLVDIVFPFKPSFFGFSQFGRSIFSRPAFFSVFYIITIFRDEELRIEVRTRIIRLIKNSLFGQGCFGTGQFFGRSFFIKDFDSSISSGMKKLDDFERAVNSKLIASNIAYFIYTF